MASSTIRFSTDASRDITGLAGGADGRIAILCNVGAFDAVLKDESGSSTAANRFDLGADITIPAQGSVILRYDATLSRWQCIGCWIGNPTATIADGDYGSITVSSSGTVWTIDSSAVTLAMMANIADQTILGNNTGGAAAPVALTASQVLTILGGGILLADGDYSDITVSSSGSTWTIDNGVVTEAKQVLADNTTCDVSITAHGYAPKAPNDATKFLDGTAAWDTVRDSDLSLSDITTNNASTSNHGFLKKLDDDATHYMDGQGNWSVVPAASDTANGIIEIAVQSEQETATSTTLAVTPGRQQYHRSAAKAWINFNGTGAIATRVSYNVTGINDLGTGHYSIDWNTDFSSGDYACGSMGGTDASTYATYVVVDGATAPTAGTLTIYTFTTAITVIDSNYVKVTAFGDQ